MGRAGGGAAPPRPPCATGPWACWRSPLPPRGGDPRAWPGWRFCPPPRRGAAGGHRHARHARHGQGHGRGPGRGGRRPVRRGGQAAGRGPAAQPQPVPEPTWRSPSVASAPGTTRWCTPSWPSRSPATPTGRGSSASCTLSPPLSPRCAASGRRPAPTSEMAAQAARVTGAPRAIGAAATARAFLAMARGDLEGVTDAAAAVRATGKAQLPGCCPYDWRSLEIEALIGLGRLGEAETALAELEAVLPPAGRRRPWWLPPGCAATWPPRPGTRPPPPRRSRPPGAAPRACGCRWRWLSWRSPTPAGCAPPASRSRPSPGCARPGSVSSRWAPGPTWRSATGSSPRLARPRGRRPRPRWRA